jgi:hypothetical protein
MRKPSPAFILALIALFVAMGGTVYAGSKLSGKTIRKSSLPGNRVKKDSITGRQVNEGSLGTVPHAAIADKPLAYGLVRGTNGALTASTSYNLKSAKVSTTGGRYCFELLSGGPPHDVQITQQLGEAPEGSSPGQAQLPPAPSFGCPPGTDDLAVQTWDGGPAPQGQDQGFFLLVY